MHRLGVIGGRQLAVVACVAVAFTSAAVRGPSVHAASAKGTGHLVPAHTAVARVPIVSRKVVLVVGDSLVAQSTAALKAQSSPELDVHVAGRLGSAPCDWTDGDFEAALNAAHPSVVVFAFAGNAGTSNGCVGSGRPRAYGLDAMIDNYRQSLTELGDAAEAAGATVILSDPPARNPLEPAPPAVATANERTSVDAYYGYQGVPQLRGLYADLVGQSSGRWRLSDAAALAVSPDFAYTPVLACDRDDGPCPTGFVNVRAGGRDAIHLDPDGHGARRFAKALISSVQHDPEPAIRAGA